MKVKDRNRRAPAQPAANNAPLTNVGQALQAAVLKSTPMELIVHPARAAHQLFLSAFNATVARVEFQPRWASGTGYFDGALEDAELRAMVRLGDRAAFVDDQGRKALVLHSKLGMVVVFEHHTHPNTLVCDAEDAYNQLHQQEVIDISTILQLPALRTLLLLTQLSAA